MCGIVVGPRWEVLEISITSVTISYESESKFKHNKKYEIQHVLQITTRALFSLERNQYLSLCLCMRYVCMMDDVTFTFRSSSSSRELRPLV